MFEFIETKRHTVESVYGKPEAEILAKIDPKDEAVEFRYPKEAERYLTICNFQVFKSLGRPDGPRLILRRKTVKRRVLTETGEVRQVVYGEYYDDGASVIRRGWPTPTNSAHPIYVESFIEVEL